MAELEKGKKYLVSEIQTTVHQRTRELECIECIKVTEKAHKIKYDDGQTLWLLKEWDLKVVEEIKNEKKTI